MTQINDINAMSDDEIISFLRNRTSHKMARERTRLISLNLEEHMKAKGIRIKCPVCGSTNKVKNGTNDSGAVRYKCKDCGKGYSSATNTIFDGCDYSWEEMVNAVKDAIINTTVGQMAANQKANNKSIKHNTAWLIKRKIYRIMASMPLPELSGIIQIDEKYFREVQKGSRSLVNLLNPSTSRNKRKHKQASQAGVLGPEFVNVLCAVDSNGYWWAKPVCLGPMGYDQLKELDEHIKKDTVSYICTDAYSLYSFWCKKNNWLHYVEPSTYRKERNARGYVNTDDMYKSLSKEDYELDKKINEELYRDGVYPHIEGTDHKLSYDEFTAIRYKFKLTINGVNSMHSHLESSWNGLKTGSTDYIADFIGKEVWLHNYKLQRGSYFSSWTYEEAEIVLCRLIRWTLQNKYSPTAKDITDSTFLDLPRPSKKAINEAIKSMKGLRQYIQFEKDAKWPDKSEYEGDDENVQFVFNKTKFFSSLSTQRRNELIFNNGLYRKGMHKDEKVKLLSQLPNAQDVIFMEIFLTNYGTVDQFKQTMATLPKERKRKRGRPRNR